MRVEKNSLKIDEWDSPDSEKHFEGVIDLLADQMKAIGRDCAREEIRIAVENAVKQEARAHFFIAEDDLGDIVGVCLVNVCSGIEACGDYVWVNEIHTRSDKRSLGVGLALLQHVVDWAGSIGCRHINAITSTGNRAAQNLCRSAGFEVSTVAWLDRRLT